MVMDPKEYDDLLEDLRLASQNQPIVNISNTCLKAYYAIQGLIAKYKGIDSCADRFFDQFIGELKESLRYKERVQELLESNNEYLERARKAEAALCNMENVYGPNRRGKA